MIAPRINAMGRLAKAIDSLRLLCVRNPIKAKELAKSLTQTNLERQKIVDEVVLHARNMVIKDYSQKVIILAHESYHEGVIGLAAGKLTEEFHRPAIVISKGKEMEKASARSIPGFNIIENLRKLDKYLQAGGGHPMAAGFSIAVSDIDIFIQKFKKLSDSLLTEEILERKLKADIEIGFKNLDMKLEEKLEEFAPFGLGNSSPVFVTRGTEVVEAKTVGREMKHLKLILRNEDKVFGAIGFNLGNLLPELMRKRKIDIAYNLEKNVWNNSVELQLKIKDLKLS
jgi:single-stranded-DNA-specific exonuclease